MKSSNSFYKIMVYFLSTLLIVQSCASTYKGSYTLPEALASKRKVQITTHDNERLKYQKVDTLKGQWVGERVIDNRIVLEPIIPNRITKIELGPTTEAQAKEGRIAIGIIAGAALFIILISGAISNMDLYGG